MRKGGSYRSPAPLQKALSVLTKHEMQSWWKSIWTDIKGASTRAGHPAPYPTELADRLIRMFSFAGDTVLDPFAGTGSTSLAAVAAGRNSINNEIEGTYLKIAHHRLVEATKRDRLIGAVRATVHVDTSDKRSLTKAKIIALPLAGSLPKSV